MAILSTLFFQDVVYKNVPFRDSAWKCNDFPMRENDVCKQTWLFFLANGISESSLALWPCVFSWTAFTSLLNRGPDRHMKEHVLESPYIMAKCGTRQDHMILTSIDPTAWKKHQSGQQHHLIQGKTPLNTELKTAWNVF